MWGESQRFACGTRRARREVARWRENDAIWSTKRCVGFVEVEVIGQAERGAEILLAPRAAWSRIEAEAIPIRHLFSGYVLIFGALNPVCLTVGRLVFGDRVLGAVYRPPLAAALLEAALGYGLIVLSVWVLGGLIQVLARPFGASRDGACALRVAAYSSTPGWAASVFYLYPPLGSLALMGQLYTLYLLYLGVQSLLRPRGRVLAYVALVVVCYILLMMLAISLTKLLAAMV